MIIAVSGGIGSGKSTVSEILREKGKTVISADEVNAALISDTEYIKIIEKNFPFAVKNGVIDKKELRNIIFNDENGRKRLNGIAHPLIAERIKKLIAEYGGNVFLEIPLLIESGMEKDADIIFAVWASKEDRLQNIMRRDNISRESAEKIISAQAVEDEIYAVADEIIRNIGTKEDLRACIEKVLIKYSV